MILKKFLLRFSIYTFFSFLLISALILSTGCIEEKNETESINITHDYQRIEPDCPEGEYFSPAAAEECRIWMEEGSWIPTLVFDSDTPDSKIIEIMNRYFGSYDTEWRIYNFSSRFPQYLDSPKEDYNNYVDMLRDEWGFVLNCYSNCSPMLFISFEKEKEDNVILGLPSCPPGNDNCFEEMKEAGIPVKKTKSASPMNYVTDNSNEEMLGVLEEIDEDEDVLFVIKAYLFDR